MINKANFVGGLEIVKSYVDKLDALGDSLGVDLGESFLTELEDLTVDLLIMQANPNFTRVQHDYFCERVWGALFTGENCADLYTEIVAGHVPTEYIEQFG